MNNEPLTTTVNIRGVEHYCEWITESGVIGNKPVMVFIHGWGGSSRYWRTTAASLVKDFDCLLYDLRGFGRSAFPSPPNLSYELEDYAEDLAILLDKFNLNRVYLNAHSMGASVATFFLNRYPEKVAKAILTCSGIFEYDKKAFEAFYKFGGYVVKFRYKWFLNIPFAEDFFMARFLNRPIEKSFKKAFLEDFLLANYEAALGTIYTSVSKKAVETMPQEFSKLTVPTLLVAGEKDIIIPAEMGKKAASLNEQIRYLEISDTAHFPMLEDANTYLKNVQDFLGAG
jgi:pimeloyl-ACP methyl ester carboxylesterase